ncbi:MAG: prepilin peptidase [Desulfobacterales bacterium]
MMTDPLYILAVFVFGLMIGSFLNVCIHRLPESLSIVYPGSRCLRCGHSIKFYDNIPVLSYLILRGKCRNCASPISIRYPLVELMSALIAVAVFLKYGLTLESLIYYIWMAALLVVTFIDIDHQIIPDVITLPGVVFFFSASFFLSGVTWKESILGILLGGCSLYAVAWLYELLMKKEGMGGGDIKLLAMMGAAIGWKGVLFTIFASSLIGSIVGVIIMAFSEKDLKLAIPFGPFLSIGGILFVFFGHELAAWYLNML